MTSHQLKLIEIFQRANLDWLFSESADERSKGILDDLRHVEAEYNALYAFKVDLLDACDRNADELLPFIQSLAVPMDNKFRRMILRILTGVSIAELTLTYKYKSSAHLKIVLRDEQDREETFESSDLWDVEVVRHFGLMKLGDKPVIEGYYVSRKD